MTSRVLKLAHPWKNTSHPEAHHGPPLIKRFEAGAELLEIQRDGASVEDAVIRLAAWMDLAADHLTEDDEVVLVGIGAMSYPLRTRAISAWSFT